MGAEGTFHSFVEGLKKLYGEFDPESKKFEKASNSEIARELGYSDSQFSRLINEHATEGEYKRANQNVARILSIISYEAKFARINVDPKKALASPRKSLLYFLVGLFLGAFALYVVFRSSDPVHIEQSTRYDMLKWTFESNFINPYKGLRELPADCDYECYKYQGRWELKNEYKLPFLRERSGFHYLAKSVISYIRCSPDNNEGGRSMQGYEYQEHEIWYDILERPISNFVHESGEPLPFYDTLKFNEDPDFVKVGTIHSFYTNDFTLDSLDVQRHGQDIGRDIEFIPEELLATQLNNKSLLEKIKREITLIVQDPLRDFSKPSSCFAAEKPNEDYNEIANGDEMTFECQMVTAGRFPIHYSKTYVLVDQFIKDKCISSIDQ